MLSGVPKPMRLFSAAVAQGIDEQGKGWRGLPAAPVVEVVVRERRTPVGKHPDETPFVEVFLDPILQQVC
jgi:hypothetical protein